MSNVPLSPIRRLLTHRIISRGRPARQPQSLARAFAHPEGAGLIGPGAEHLLRTVLVNALVDDPERLNVVITLPDLEQLLGDPSALPLELLASTLYVTEALEEAIEHLESRHPRISIAGSRKQPPTLWLANPGPDADVVHQTVELLPANSIIALFQGPWPYGPTHLIDMDGPRRLPIQDLNLLSRSQAVARLHAPDTR